MPTKQYPLLEVDQELTPLYWEQQVLSTLERVRYKSMTWIHIVQVKPRSGVLFDMLFGTHSTHIDELIDQLKAVNLMKVYRLR